MAMSRTPQSPLHHPSCFDVLQESYTDRLEFTVSGQRARIEKLDAALARVLSEPSLNLQPDDGTDLAPWLRAAYDALK
jgi:hypothetical protein